MKQLLTNIRAWKNRTFPDWLWDVLVGAACTLLGSAVWAFVAWLGYRHGSIMLLAVPFSITVINQYFINKLFEPKDFALRLAVPVVVYIFTLF